MKTKPLLMFFVFILTLTSTCLFAQPAKTAALPSIIKKVDIPWPVSVTADEKENRVFVMSAAGEDSAVFVLDGKNNSVIKRIRIKEGLLSHAAGNGMVYNPNTKRLYALVDPGKSGYLATVLDTKLYNILSLIENLKYDDGAYLFSLSINLSELDNIIYAIPRHYKYILAFNLATNKLVERLEYAGRGNFSAISDDGNFLYIVADNLLKFDTKAKKVVASLPIRVATVPLVDEKNGLIFAGTGYKLYIIDIERFKIKDEREDIPVSSRIGGVSIVLNPTTNHLFVPTYNDSVSVIDVKTMKTLTTIKVGQTVKSIAVNSKTNRVYVTLVNEENKVIVIQDR